MQDSDDPKTAKKVLDITEEIVAKDNLITIMITHNMADFLPAIIFAPLIYNIISLFEKLADMFV